MTGAVESPVPTDDRPCPFCDQPLAAGHCALAFLETGEVRWACQLCAIKANGGRSSMIPSAQVAA